MNTQNIIAYETNVAAPLIPFVESYFVENLTNQLEEEAWKLMGKIEEQGECFKRHSPAGSNRKSRLCATISGGPEE